VSVIVVGYVSNLIHDISVVRLTSSLSKFLNFGLLITILLPKIDYCQNQNCAQIASFVRKTPDSSDKFTKYPCLPLEDERRKRLAQEGHLKCNSVRKKMKKLRRKNKNKNR
jgi:hypothetical protein